MRFIQTLGFVSCALAAALPVDFERRDVARQNVPETVGKVAAIPGQAVGDAAGVLQRRDIPLVGDASKTAEQVGGVPGSVVSTAGKAISRDLPLGNTLGNALNSVEETPDSVGGGLLGRELPVGNTLSGVEKTPDSVLNGVVGRDLPGVDAVKGATGTVGGVEKTVGGVVGGVKRDGLTGVGAADGTVDTVEKTVGGVAGNALGGLKRDLPNVPSIPVVPEVIDGAVAPVLGAPANALTGVVPS